MSAVSQEEMAKIMATIEKAQRMQREKEPRRQYDRQRYQKIKAGVWDRERKEKKRRIDQNLAHMNVDPVALGLSDDAAAAMASMANGVRTHRAQRAA